MHKKLMPLAVSLCAVLLWAGCAVRVDIGSSRAHAIAAAKLEREAKIKEAEDAYRLALDADRFNETAAHGLARLFLNTARPGMALPLLRKASCCAKKTPPYDAAAVSASLIILARPREAANVIEKALEREPERGDLRLLLAAACFKDKRFDRAAQEIQYLPVDPLAGAEGPPALRAAKNLGLDERSLRLLLYEVWSNYLRSLDRDRWSAEAEDIAGRAAARFPDSALFRAFLARLRYVRGERESAAELMDGAIEKDPFNMEVVREARCLYARERRYAEALEAWRRAVPREIVFAPDNKLKPRLDEIEAATREAAANMNDGGAQLRLAAAYRRMGWMDEAVAQGRLALSLDPACENARRETSLAQKHRRYLARVRQYFDAVYENEMRGLKVPDIRAMAASLGEMARSEGIILEQKGGEVYSLPPYGREIHAFNSDSGALAAYFLEFGQYLHLSQIYAPPFCKVMNIIAWFENARGIDSQCVVCDEDSVRSLSGYAANRTVIGGHSTLSRRGFYIDFDALRPDRYYIQAARDAVRSPAGDEMLAGFYSDRGRDVLLARVMRGVDVSSDDAVFQRLSEAAFNSVAFHEFGHVRDLQRFVPLCAHIPAHLFEAVRGGFSPSKIRDRIEMRAEAYSLAHSPEPHAVILNNVFRLRPVESEMRYVHYLLYYVSAEERDYSPYLYGAGAIMEFAREFMAKERLPSAETAVRLAAMEPDEVRKIGKALGRRLGMD